EGRYADALTAVEQVDDPVGIANPVWNPWRRLRAAALRGLGRAAEALPLLEEEVALLRGWGAPSSLGLSMTELGVLSGRHETLMEAVAVLETSDAAFLLSRARLALGEHPDTPSGEAVALLRDALDGAVACGAQGVAGQACGALRRLGQHATDVPAREPGPTATQQRVAALGECGMDIAEIAQALFLTPQTVHAVLGELAADGAR